MGDLSLNNEWKLYFHDPYNDDWTINSYVFIDSVNSVHEWVKIFHTFKDVWNKGMFFLMRGNINPLWEDDYNKNGGCISFKLFKNEVRDCWFELTAKTIGEVLINTSNTDDNKKISGVSISSKRGYCIVRVWLYDDILQNSDIYNIKIPSYRKMMYKSHSDNKDYKDD